MRFMIRLAAFEVEASDDFNMNSGDHIEKLEVAFKANGVPIVIEEITPLDPPNVISMDAFLARKNGVKTNA